MELSLSPWEVIVFSYSFVNWPGPCDFVGKGSPPEHLEKEIWYFQQAWVIMTNSCLSLYLLSWLCYEPTVITHGRSFQALLQDGMHQFYTFLLCGRSYSGLSVLWWLLQSSLCKSVWSGWVARKMTFDHVKKKEAGLKVIGWHWGFTEHMTNIEIQSLRPDKAFSCPLFNRD